VTWTAGVTGLQGGRIVTEKGRDKKKVVVGNTLVCPFLMPSPCVATPAESGGATAKMLQHP
jgi:hypothetical protein